MNKIKKFLYIVLGFLFLGLGAVGIVLPLIPTTPLLLLASFFFVKGSDRFDRWFKSTGLYKKYLEGFVKRREMTLRQKLTILLTADAMIAVPFIILDSIAVKLLLVAVVIYKYYYFITKIKTVAPEISTIHEQGLVEKTSHK
ncbi:YbaN family protein [Fredinandcohnia sp. QZ13]|uniref:YbaN family protein n=1 Tax=Fredinandcohnia sp. QZ13 TaxID=3073144 RepID=UPI00285344F2|nr:YbaN family protein [Fredinandcohnia sp. QZ13]MDR4888056.1 YbaN family protein [Fredinandcohnia sp. QZ13]